MGELRIHNSSGSMGHTVSDFYPLIGVLVVVCICTVMSVLLFEQPAMTSFMGWFFLVFGALKVVRISAFVEAYQMYDLIAKRSTFYAYVYPFLELGFGCAYLFMWELKLVSAIVVIVMLISAFGVFLKLKAREEIPCACLGTVFKVPMTWVTFGEDILMAGMALMLLF